MAIYSLHHQPIGKSTQARPHTSAAHVRYITRPSAASRIEAERMPDKPGKAAAFMVDGENADRKNARVSDKLMLALPKELDAEQRAQLVRGFAEEVTQGRAPWLAAFHDQGKDAHNPHAHLVIRDRDPDSGKRVAGLSEKGSTDRLRTLWETHSNRALEGAGRPERIDRRTLEAQGLRREPTVHEGPKAQQMDRRGARPESRMRRYRNRPGSHLPYRNVDYRGVDAGRSRPDYNRQVRRRETPEDYWRAVDADNQKREMDQLRQIHHRPESVIAFPARRPEPHGGVNHQAVEPGVLRSNLPGIRVPELPDKGGLATGEPRHIGLKGPPERVGRTPGQQEVLQPSQRTAKEPTKPIEQDILHKDIIGNKNLNGKEESMSVDDEDRKHREADLARARAKEGKSRAARDNALEAGYMRPEFAKNDIGNYYKDHGEEGLRKKFGEFAGPSEFGVKPGNPLTKEGRAKRRNANEARRAMPGLWGAHDRDAKDLAASERSFRDKFGSPDTPSEGKPQATGKQPASAPSGAAGGLPQGGGARLQPSASPLESPSRAGQGEARPKSLATPDDVHNPWEHLPANHPLAMPKAAPEAGKSAPSSSDPGRHRLSLKSPPVGKGAPDAEPKTPAHTPEAGRNPLSLKSPALPKASPSAPPASPQGLGREALKTPIGKEPRYRKQKGLADGM